MNILVTTPKIEMSNSALEGEQVRQDLSIGMNAYWFRTFHFRPKVDIGDRMYFTEDGLIKGYGVIFKIEQIEEPESESVCDTTGRVWGRHGDWMVSYRDWHWLKTPIRFKGFQGIRYIDNIPDLHKQLIESE